MQLNNRMGNGNIYNDPSSTIEADDLFSCAIRAREKKTRLEKSQVPCKKVEETPQTEKSRKTQKLQNFPKTQI